MHRIFAPLVAPLIEAVQPHAIVETGAGTGRLTRRILEAPAARTARLHAIDPVPSLDPLLREKAGERLEVHAERAIGAIGRIGAVDLALLDGDPNWYSVHSELKMLVDAAERGQRPAPLVVVHQVHWPFGRRDGYYEPDAIPTAQRHEHSDLGLVPGRREPCPEGLRLVPYCATRDFEPRSGVLTAVEDMVAESDLGWTMLEVPGFHGCAVLAEARLLSERPEIAKVLEGLRAPSFLGRQVRRAEAARLDAEVELAALRAQPVAPGPEPEVEPLPEEPEPVFAEEPGPVEVPIPEPEPEPAPAPAPAPEIVALIRELAEHKAQREALEWRLDRLDEEIVIRDTRLTALTGERDEQRLGVVEARVRLEEATKRLGEERAAAAVLTERVVELEDQADARARELHEVAELEKLATGRLAHREDALQAADAEASRLRGEVKALEDQLSAGRDLLDGIASRIDEASTARWARFGRRMGRIGRTLTFRGATRPPDPYELARQAAERGLPATPVTGDDGELAEDHPGAVEMDVRRPG